MAFTSEKRDWWHEYRCTPGIEMPTGFFGRFPVRAANQDVIEAYQALEQAHIGAGYIPISGGFIGSRRNCPAGIGGRICRQDGGNCSLHNYCLALDVEYQYNKLGPFYPDLHTPEDIFVRDALLHKYSPVIIDKIENVRNKEGKALFRWLGWIGDYMHWEIDVPPEEVSVDWDTVPNGVAPQPPPEKEPAVYMLPVLRKGDGLVSRAYGDRTHLKTEVASLQAALRAERFQESGTSNDAVCNIDGAFWDGTEGVVKDFQRARGLTVDGIAGEQTYTELFGRKA